MELPGNCHGTATDLNGKRVTVMGLGSFGGGIGAVRFLVSQGARVTVTDQRPAADLAGALAQLEHFQPAVWRLGEHVDADFTAADLIVVSPAVPRESPYLELARRAGVPLSSEMNLFWERCRGTTVCVTGTNGKSTTTALLHALLEQDPTLRCWLGGNIGRSLLPDVAAINADDRVVLELSSFQLDQLAPLQPAPDVAVVTNFAPNHLDRHGTLADYRAAKQNLLRWQRPDQVAILNQDDPDVCGWGTQGRKYWFGFRDTGRPGLFGLEPGSNAALFRDGAREERLPLGDWLKLPGVHNRQNALAAVCAARVLRTDPAAIRAGMSGFAGLPHRLELVAEVSGRRFYNDSKATTPEAALLALNAFEQPIVLLAGGYDKGINLQGLANGIARRAKAVALLGQTAPELDRHLAVIDCGRRVPRETTADFESAFAWACDQSAPGDIILLSPGCASYDWFTNYEARGDRFRQLALSCCDECGAADR